MYKDEEEPGGICPGIIMIFKDLSKHVIVVSNNINEHKLLCKLLTNTFIFCCYLILLQPKLIAYFLPQEYNIFAFPR